MAGICVVLNGASSAGKTAIASRLQHIWPGPLPLQVSGLDTFLSCQDRGFYGIDGATAPGFWWRQAVIDGAPAQEIVTGPLGAALVRAAQLFWRACADEGLDQVVDDVWLTREQALGFKETMAGTEVMWVGVRCTLEVLEAREAARGDRPKGQALGQFHTVHSWTGYDLEMDTSFSTPDDCAAMILAALAAEGRLG